MVYIENEENYIDEKIMVDHLKRVINILNIHDIDYWISFGTLLGFIREKCFIPWDADIDIVVSNIYDIINLKSEFEDAGFILTIERNHKKYTKIVKLNDKKLKFKLDVDFYEFLTENNQLINTRLERKNIISKISRLYILLYDKKVKQGNLSLKSKQNISKIIIMMPFSFYFYNIFRHLDLFFSFKKLMIFPKIKIKWNKFYGVKIKIPEDSEKILSLLYGKNWEIPSKQFKNYCPDSEKYKSRKMSISKLDDT